MGGYSGIRKDLPQELRWREWMGRVEAVLFASASPVSREDLARVVGQGASVEMLIEDIQAELTGRPYELAQVAGGWMFRTRPQFADAIKTTADLGDQSLAFTEMEMGVLCAIAYHQPIDRAGLVGADGATHAGSFDITYLATLPNFVVMAASDEAELAHMTYTAAEYDEGPIAFRYPRGAGTGVARAGRHPSTVRDCRGAA
mgnify:CR=1 FL=1